MNKGRGRVSCGRLRFLWQRFYTLVPAWPSVVYPNAESKEILPNTLNVLLISLTSSTDTCSGT